MILAHFRRVRVGFLIGNGSTEIFLVDPKAPGYENFNLTLMPVWFATIKNFFTPTFSPLLTNTILLQFECVCFSVTFKTTIAWSDCAKDTRVHVSSSSSPPYAV